MAQNRSKQRGIANLVTCTLLLLFGALGLAAGCSSYGEAPGDETVVAQSEGLIGCNCPDNNPCATFTCSGTKCVVKEQLLKEGDRCGDKLGFPGVCHLNLCCPGCVVVNRVGPPECARAEGMANTQCGATGTTCENCTLDKCQVPACDGKSCNLKPVPDGGSCVNTPGFCSKGTCCTGCVDGDGACLPGNTLTQCGASTDQLVKCNDCSDRAPCTADACVSGKCEAPAVPPGTSCDDGNVCNGVSECSGTACKAGTALNCDDGDPCTTDSCDAVDGCKHVPNPGVACNDGDPCTTGEKCTAQGLCANGMVNTCNDNQPCTADACKGGECVHTPVTPGTTCNDGNGCTTTDTCNDSGKCVGTGGPSCDDDKPCTKNACTANVCSNPFEPNTVPCIFDKCTQNSHCSGTSDACVAGTPIDCNDANPCTTDSCDPAQGCVHVPNNVAECVDGDACTVNDECVDGTCQGTPMPCLAIDACHEAGTCNPLTGRCDDPRAEDGKECPGGTCETGVCKPNPLGEGGAGGAGEPVGVGGGENQAGAGASTGGNPAAAGMPSEPEPEPGEGGSGEPEERPFVRDPGGCSCGVPGTNDTNSAWLAALALAAVLLGRRRSGSETRS